MGHRKSLRILGGFALVAGVALVVAFASASQEGGPDEPKAPAPGGEATGQDQADAILARWRAANPNVDWEADEREAHALVESYDNSDLITEGSQADGHPYRKITERDVLLWKRETERFVLMGSRIFHSADELGSTVGVSCDMCHPHAANTHPETYPKYQTQLGKTILLRDMINWCLQQPLRAEPMAEDDPRLRALEGYIYAQRSGKVLAYGKH